MWGDTWSIINNTTDMPGTTSEVFFRQEEDFILTSRAPGLTPGQARSAGLVRRVPVDPGFPVHRRRHHLTPWRTNCDHRQLQWKLNSRTVAWSTQCWDVHRTCTQVHILQVFINFSMQEMIALSALHYRAFICRTQSIEEIDSFACMLLCKWVHTLGAHSSSLDSGAFPPPPPPSPSFFKSFSSLTPSSPCAFLPQE